MDYNDKKYDKLPKIDGYTKKEIIQFYEFLKSVYIFYGKNFSHFSKMGENLNQKFLSIGNLNIFNHFLWGMKYAIDNTAPYTHSFTDKFIKLMEDIECNS